MNDINRKGKKIILVILIVIASIVLLAATFGTVDYVRAKNGKNQYLYFIVIV